MVVPNSWPRSTRRSPVSSSQLGREGAGPDPGRVGLGDPPDLGDVGRADAGADGRRAGDRVGGGDEGIGAVVEVEQRRLGALEDHRLAGVERVPAQARGVGDVRLQPVAVADVFLDHAVDVEPRVGHAGRRLGDRLRFLAGFLADLAPLHGELPQRLLLGLQRRPDLGPQDLLVEQILDADPEPQRLVGVGGADPAPRGADRVLPQFRLAGGVEQHVVGHDQVRVGRDPQVADADARPFQAVDLTQQHPRVDDHAVADHAGLLRVQDPGGDQVELELLTVADDRVAGVVAALEADDHLSVLGEQIGDLPLALIAPLGSDYDHARHSGGL